MTKELNFLLLSYCQRKCWLLSYAQICRQKPEMNQWQEISKIISTITHLNKYFEVPAPIIEPQIPKLYLQNTDGRACLERLNRGNNQNILKKLQTKKLKPIKCQLYIEEKLLKVALIEIASMMQGKDISSILDSKWIVTEQNYAMHRIQSTITFPRMKQRKIRIQLEFPTDNLTVIMIPTDNFAYEHQQSGGAYICWICKI